MKYRTKLYAAVIGTAMASSILGLGILYVETRRVTLQEYGDQLIAIATTTSLFIDSALVAQIHSPTDEGSAPYNALKNGLRLARDANRRPNIDVRFLYLLKPNPEHSAQLMALVDAENSPTEKMGVGAPFKRADPELVLQHLNTPYSPMRFYTDEWGSWLSGFAPIHDANGNYIATVGVDIDARDVYARFDKRLWFGLLALGISLVIACNAAFVLGHRVTLSLTALCNYVAKVGAGDLKHPLHLKTKDEFAELAEEVNTMAKGLDERERLKANFASYVSEYVLNQILQSGKPLRLEGEMRKVTLLFSDIRGFTRLSEKLPPEEVVALLNEYFSEMLEIVFHYQGTLDKFLGDGLMAEFGAPLDDPLQEEHAVLTAIDMQKRLQEMGDRWEKEGKPRLKIGIGIHTGLAVVGNLGTSERMQYTAIGDTVNVAAKLQTATKTLNTPIVMSESTAQAIEGKFSLKNLGTHTLPGRDTPFTIYGIVGSYDKT